MKLSELGKDLILILFHGKVTQNPGFSTANQNPNIWGFIQIGSQGIISFIQYQVRDWKFAFAFQIIIFLLELKGFMLVANDYD